MAVPKSLTSRTTSKKITIMAFNYFLDAFRYNYANFEGRARRSEYWFFRLFDFLAILALIFLFIISEIKYSFIFLIIYILASIVPRIAIEIRRMHDIGKSGWFILVAVIPVIGGIWRLVLLATDSQDGENEYGPNPKGISNNDDSIIQNIGQ